MATTINSVFDVLSGLTVDEMLANPHFMPEQFLESLEGEEVQKLFFRDETVTSNVIAYREALPPSLEDEVENVAEFGEIPVSDPVGGEWLTTAVNKVGIGIRVSWEQRKDNDGAAVIRELEARRTTVLRREARDALAALAAANVQELAAPVAWDQPGATPATDVLDAAELILGAEDGDGHYFEYVPDVLWINPVSLNILKRNEEVQRLYIGDMASQNPIFKGVEDEPVLFGNIQVAKSFFVPKGEAYLGVQGKAGFRGEREERQATDFYAEHGESHLGGSTMSFRSDVSHRRGYAVDGPKSVIKLTGLVTP